MKQYDLVMFFDDFERPTAIVGENPRGRYVRAADLQAWALKLKDVVEGMGHFTLCDTWNPGINSGCTCPRGDLLREIGEILT